MGLEVTPGDEGSVYDDPNFWSVYDTYMTNQGYDADARKNEKQIRAAWTLWQVGNIDENGNIVSDIPSNVDKPDEA